MKILVTGGAGFIGSCFVRYMLEHYPEYKIVNYDALTYAGNIENLYDVKDNPNYEFVQGDICDKRLVFGVVSGVDAIVNFAAETHVDRSITGPEIFIETNVKGTLTLLQAAKQFNIERFVQIKFMAALVKKVILQKQLPLLRTVLIQHQKQARICLSEHIMKPLACLP